MKQKQRNITEKKKRRARKKFKRKMGLKLFVMVKLQNLQQFNCVNVGKICMKRSRVHKGKKKQFRVFVCKSWKREQCTHSICECVCVIFAVKIQFQINIFVLLILRFASILLYWILCAFLQVYLHCILEAVQVNLRAATYKEQSAKEKQSKKWNHFLRTSDGGCCC